MNAKEYAAFIENINTLIPERNKVIFIAGHDHSLQVIGHAKGADYSIVSGAGSNTSPACHGDDTLFAHETLGHVEIGFRQNGEITAEAFSFRAEGNRLSKVYSQRLF